MNLLIGTSEKGKEIKHDLEKLPLILMAGQTGSGKSNITHSFICSLLERFKPQDINLYLLDCKNVEFNHFYKNILHLFAPIGHCGSSDFLEFKKLEKEIDKRKNVMGTLSK